MLHAETLFFVHDKESQILESHVLRQQPVGADHQIHLSFFKLLHRLLLLSRTAESGKNVHCKGEVLKSFLKSVVMLVGQYCGGHQHSSLLSFCQTLEDCSGSNFSLSEAHVAQKKPVHAEWLFHVLFDLFRSFQLIVSLLKRKSVLELTLPWSVFAESMARFHLSLGIEIYQILGHNSDSRLGFGLRGLPFSAGKLVDLRYRIVSCDVLLYHVHLFDGYVKKVVSCVFDLYVILDLSLYLKLVDPGEFTDAVVFMYDKITFFKVGEGAQGLVPVSCFLSLFLLWLTENIPFGKPYPLVQRKIYSLAEASPHEVYGSQIGSVAELP